MDINRSPGEGEDVGDVLNHSSSALDAASTLLQISGDASASSTPTISATLSPTNQAICTTPSSTSTTSAPATDNSNLTPPSANASTNSPNGGPPVNQHSYALPYNDHNYGNKSTTSAMISANETTGGGGDAAGVSGPSALDDQEEEENKEDRSRYIIESIEDAFGGGGDQAARTRPIEPSTGQHARGVGVRTAPQRASNNLCATQRMGTITSGVMANRSTRSESGGAVTVMKATSPITTTIVHRRDAEGTMRTEPARVVLINGVPALRRVAPSQIPLNARATMQVARRAPHAVFRHRQALQPQHVRGRGGLLPTNGSPMVLGQSARGGAVRSGLIIQRGGATRMSQRGGARGAARVTARTGTMSVLDHPIVTKENIVRIGHEEEVDMSIDVAGLTDEQKPAAKLKTTPKLFDNGACARTLGLRQAECRQPQRAPRGGGRARGRGRPAAHVFIPNVKREPSMPISPYKEGIAMGSSVSANINMGAHGSAVNEVVNAVNAAHLQRKEEQAKKNAALLEAQQAALLHVKQQKQLEEQLKPSIASPVTVAQLPSVQMILDRAQRELQEAKACHVPVVVKVEEGETKEDPYAFATMDAGESTSSTETDSEVEHEDEWAGSEYTTRCLCALQHTDDFMIQCDQCDVWQHCRCMGVDQRRMPEDYKCERCAPRPMKLTAEKARSIQQKKLSVEAAAKLRRKVMRKRRREQRNIRRTKAQHRLKQAAETQKNFVEIDANEYTVGAQKLVMTIPNTVCHSSSPSNHIGPYLQTNVDLLCQPEVPATAAMFVAPGTMGLVSTTAISLDQVLAEQLGVVTLRSECPSLDAQGRLVNYTFAYGGVSTTAQLTIDARGRGGKARFVRRSCMPNAHMKHVVVNGKLHIVLLAEAAMASGTEICLKHDDDYKLCLHRVVCACGSMSDRCPVFKFNLSITSRIGVKKGRGRPPTHKPTTASPSKSTSATQAAGALRRAKLVKSKNAIKKIVKKASAVRRTTVKLPISRRPRKEEAEEGELEDSDYDDDVKPIIKRRSISTTRKSASTTVPKSLRNLDDAWNKVTVKVDTMDSPPVDTTHMSREERKMAQYEEQFRRMEMEQKRKSIGERASPEVVAVAKSRRSATPAKSVKKKPTVVVARRKSPSKFVPATKRTRNSNSFGSSHAHDSDDSLQSPHRRSGRQATKRAGNTSHPSDSDIISGLVDPSTVAKSKSPAAAPPRKRWATTVQEDEAPSTSGNTGEPSTSGNTGEPSRPMRATRMSDETTAPRTTPIAVPGGKKRWLRRAEQELQQSSVSFGEPPPIVTTMECAIAQPPSTSSSQQPSPSVTTPAPIKRRKVTLDEYKKRKSTHEEVQTPAANTGFMPNTTEASGDLHLAPVPDPSLIGKPTSSLEDLKKKIFTNTLGGGVRSTTTSTRSPLPPANGPPDEARPIDMHNMTLDERLAHQFGVRSQPTRESVRNNGVGLR